MDRDIAVALFVVGFGVLYALIPVWLAVAAYKWRKNRLFWALVGLLLSISTFFLCVGILSTTEFGGTIIRRLGPMSILFGFGFVVASLISLQISNRLLSSDVEANGDPRSPITIWADGVPTRILFQLTFSILGLVVAMTWLLSRLVPVPGSVGFMPYPISIIGILGCGGYLLSSSYSMVGRLRTDSTKRSQWVRILPPAILLLVIVCTLCGWWWWQDYSRDQAPMRQIQDAPRSLHR